MSADHAARKFLKAWGKIVSGDLGLLEDGLYTLNRRCESGNRWLPHQALLTGADVTSTFVDLAERVLGVEAPAVCYQLLSSQELGTAATFVDDLLLRWAGSTDPNLQEKAAWLWFGLAPANAEKVAQHDAVQDVLVNLFTSIDMKRPKSKKSLSETFINTYHKLSCRQTLRVLMLCGLCALQTAWRDSNAEVYARDLILLTGVRIYHWHHDLVHSYFDCIHHYFNDSMKCGATAAAVIRGFLFRVPKEKFDLTSLVLQPSLLNTFRGVFTLTRLSAISNCEGFLSIWSKLAAVEPRAVMEMIRLDFLGGMITHVTTNWSQPWVEFTAAFAFPSLVSLMINMLDVSKQDTVEYFFSTGFIKFLAAVTKVRVFLLTKDISDMFERLERVIRCFEKANPPSTAPLAAFDLMPFTTAISHGAPTTDVADGHPAWVHVTDYDDISLAPVPIDNLEAFAAASGNAYIASFFVDLLAPTPNDEALSHDEQWKWLTNPNPVCLAVMRHLLHNKPATKKALFAAAGIHELSRNARDFEPRPDDPTRSYYRDEDGNDVCERPQ